MKRKLFILILMTSTSYAVPVIAESFKNCTAVNKTYPWGVSRSLDAAKKQKNYPVNNPFVSSKLYESLKKMDRDKDGTACEK